jgi:hypothetical protein
MGSNVASGIATNTMAGGIAAGNALAGGQINQANAYTGGIKSTGNSLMDALILNKMTGAGGGGSSAWNGLQYGID